MISHEFLQRYHKHIILASLTLLVGIFVYLRFHSIQMETVPYTYDQGRDFLAARDIIVERDITLIGPTTGAGGVFHGAWWYYFLAIPFALTGGQPLAFFYAISLFALVQGGLFYFFLKNKTHPLLALLFMSIVAVSPYFIRTSIFAISSIMTLPFILLFMFALYRYLETSKLVYLGLFSFSIGMILEGEVAFAVFLIPSVIIALLLTRTLLSFMNSVKKVAYLAGGFVAATSLRILFELRYSFMQTKSLWKFKDTPGTHDVGLSSAFDERVQVFHGYFRDIFPNQLESAGWVLLALAVAGIIVGYRSYKDHERKFTLITAFIVILLFVTSLAYNKNFFWPYYYEGIQYFFVGLMLFGLYGLVRYKKKLGLAVIGLYLVLFTVVGITEAYQKYSSFEKPEPIGLRMHMLAIDYVHEQVGSDEFCLRIYTPPVRTHTYDYLLDLKARTQGMTYPRTVYKDNECWYLIESDENNERWDAWIADNIPDEGKLMHEHVVSDNLVIQKWQYPVHEESDE